VKQIFVCLLLPVFLLNGSLSEFCKLPVLFTHFSEHRQADQHLSLIEFLGMHYGGTDLDSRDDARDAALPFKQARESDTYELFIPALEEPIFSKAFTIAAAPIPGSVYRRLPDPAFDPLLKPPCC
jgi:hypothetical protein